MTDVLLAHSYYLNEDPKQLQKMRPYPPLATLYAAAALRRAGFRVALYDAMLADGEHRFLEALRLHQPRFVVLCEDSFNFLIKMCLLRMREAALRAIRAAREAGAVTLASGPDVTDHPEAYLAAGLHCALLGEADHTVVEALESLDGRSGRSLDAVHGLAVLRDGTLHRTPPRLPERHPDVFPLPAWDLVDPEPYRAAWTKAHGFFSLNLVTSRGCPYRCNWCAKPIWGQAYAIRSAASVAQEMRLVKSTLRPDHIWFADDIFGLRPGWVEEFARQVEARNARIPFTIQSRADRMAPDTVAALKRAGCKEVWMGAESGSQRILDAMDKDTTVEEIRTARARLREQGIRACFFLQFGYPGETLDDIRLTVEMVRKTLPDEVGISVSYPLPGTPFYERVRHQLAGKTQWTHSGDLAMMFQGTFTTAFYRRLHRLVHRDLDLRRALAAGDSRGHDAAAEQEALDRDWEDLMRAADRERSARPTTLAPAPEPEGAPRSPSLTRLRLQPTG